MDSDTPATGDSDEPTGGVLPEAAPLPEAEPVSLEKAESVPLVESESEIRPSEVPEPDPEPVVNALYCSACGAPRIEGARFCPACGHAHDGGSVAAAAGSDDEPPKPLDRKWVITAAVSAVVLVLLIIVLIIRQDEPGPSNKNAKAACNEMARVSTEIIEGRAESFAGQLDKVVKSSQAAARDDKDYAALAAAVKRLSEDPTISSAKGGKAVERIAEECK